MNYFVNSYSGNIDWDVVRSPKQVRCQNCQMNISFYMAPLDDRPKTKDCTECQGTNRDAIPWTELYIRAPYKRRDS
jgi:hypothetical protein